MKSRVRFFCRDSSVHPPPMHFHLAIKDLKTRLAYLVIIEEKRRKSGQGTVP
jgi:hypothetical protein